MNQTNDLKPGFATEMQLEVGKEELHESREPPWVPGIERMMRRDKVVVRKAITVVGTAWEALLNHKSVFMRCRRKIAWDQLDQGVCEGGRTYTIEVKAITVNEFPCTQSRARFDGSVESQSKLGGAYGFYDG